jgi:hypothetical protein
MQPGEDKKDGPQTQANNRAQQPAQVVARGAQHGMQRIAGLPFERNNRPAAANRAEETKGGFGVAKSNAALRKTGEAMVRNARL